MLMKDVKSNELSVDELLEIYGGDLDFPDDEKDITFDPEDEKTQKDNREYLEYLTETAKASGFGIKMNLV